MAKKRRNAETNKYQSGMLGRVRKLPSSRRERGEELANIADDFRLSFSLFP
jgi:hypothetical protein